MSTTEEKATDSAAASAKPEGEPQAAATTGQGAESAESKDASASEPVPAEPANAAPAEEAKKPSADEASTDEASAGTEEGGEVLEIEVEAVDEPVDPLEELKTKVSELEKGKKTNYDRFLRASADLENFRKRSRRDVKDARLDERGKILRDMLPVIDNLDRAVAHAVQTEAEATKSIVEGVNLVLRQFRQALERHSVTPLDAVGKPFDPALHEAVSQAPSAEHPPGTIVSALQTGYMMDGRLLRPALVVVSIAMPAEEKPGSEEASEEKPEEPKSAAADVIDVESTEEESGSVVAFSDKSSGAAAAEDSSPKSASATEAKSTEAEESNESESSAKADAAPAAEADATPAAEADAAPAAAADATPAAAADAAPSKDKE